MNGIKALAFLAKRGVTVTMLNETEYMVDGFYKSGTVNVNIETNTITARYNTVTKVDEYDNLLETLIRVNEYWKDVTESRNGSEISFDSSWATVMKDYQMVAV